MFSPPPPCEKRKPLRLIPTSRDKRSRGSASIPVSQCGEGVQEEEVQEEERGDLCAERGWTKEREKPAIVREAIGEPVFEIPICDCVCAHTSVLTRQSDLADIFAHISTHMLREWLQEQEIFWYEIYSGCGERRRKGEGFVHRGGRC